MLGMGTLPTSEQVQAALATVNDPEIRRPITDLGMIKSVDIGSNGQITVAVFLTVAGCPLRDTITRDVTAAVSALPGVTGVSVELDVMSQEQRQQLQTRLRRIEGQVRGVARMIDEDKYCVDVVTQVAAIQAALDKVSLGLLDGHIRGCVREEIRSGGGEDKVDELLEVMDRVLRR